MAKIKFSEILTNPYTGEEVEVKGSTEEIFLRRRDATIQKWKNEQSRFENEQYVLEQQEKADELTDQLKPLFDYLNKLCYCNLNPLTPESYLSENIAAVKQLHRNKPTLDIAEKDVGINTFVKVTGIIPGKSKDKLKDLQAKAQDLLETRLEDYDQKVISDREKYLQKRKKKESQLKNHITGLSEGKKVASNLYYSYALDRDDYSVNAEDRFFPEYSFIHYTPNNGEIRLSYRIPNEDEILSIAKYKYDAKSDNIIPIPHDRKTAVRWKLRIAESVLLRTAVLIFLSDCYKKVKIVSITGYIRYYDSAFGNDQKKNVIHMTLSRDIFEKLSLETLDPFDLFNRVLKATISSSLYAKEPYAISEIN